MKLPNLKKIVFIATASVSHICSFGQLSNTGFMYIGPNTQLYVADNFQNTNQAKLLNIGTISLTGNFQNEETNSVSGSIEMVGQNPQIISGRGATIFTNVKVDNTAGVLLTNPYTLINKNLILSNGSLVIPSNATLGHNGNVITTNGNIAGNETANLIVGGAGNGGNYSFSPGNEKLAALVLNKTNNGVIGLNTKLDVYSRLSLIAGSLNTASSTNNNAGINHLTLKANTDSVAILDVVGEDATIYGNVTLEKYIYPYRGWRLLNAPIQVDKQHPQTIHQSWQENQPTASTNLVGYGTQISGSNNALPINTIADGYDIIFSGNAKPSILNFDGTTWQTLTTSLTATPITQREGFLLFVRGDRTVVPGTQSAPTATILRTTGNLKTGEQTYVLQDGMNLIGNPYAAPIDFEKLTLNNVPKQFWVIDPQLNNGGYVVYDNTSGIPLMAPLIGEYKTISSKIDFGQSFIINKPATASTSLSTVTIKESSKFINAAYKAQPSAIQSKQLDHGTISINLWYTDNANNTLPIDGVLGVYNPNFDNYITQEDAPKLQNLAENLSIHVLNSDIAIEKRKSYQDYDTLFLNLSKMDTKSYFFEIQGQNLFPPLNAFLIDNYLQTNTPFTMAQGAKYNFTAEANPLSYAQDRFKIVFKIGIGELTLAAQKNGLLGVALDWNNSYETNMNNYSLERSADNVRFNSIQTSAAKAGTNVPSSYQTVDQLPLDGVNYYRIKATANNAETAYSNTVRIDLGTSPLDKPYMALITNPITTQSFQLKFSNLTAAKYLIKLMAVDGTPVLNRELSHSGGTNLYTIDMNINVPRGLYILDVSNEAGFKYQVKAEVMQ